ncbi:MAG: carboxypeptidase-like regulatory domain-containing protein [Planctomycetota bacterium]
MTNLATVFLLLLQQAPPTVAIEGRVVDLRGDGVPVAKVVVSSWREPDVVLARGVSDGDGYFRLAKVPKRESLRLRADKDGLCAGWGWVADPPQPLRIAVHDAATVRGVLRDRAGKPVPHAAVRAKLFARILFNTTCDAETDDEGAFALTGVPLGLVRFAAVVPGEGVADARSLVQGDTAIALAPGDDRTTALAVEVTGLSKEEAARVGATILPYGEGRLTELPPPWDRPAFDAEGRFELSPVPDLEYRVRPGLAGYAFEPNERVAGPGAGPHRLQFTARPTGGAALRCKAVLRDGDGKALGGVPLVMRQFSGGLRAEATSGEDGGVEFASPLGAGTKVIVYAVDRRWVLDQEKVQGLSGAWDRRFLVDHECVVDPEAVLELRAVPACSVRGTLRLADGRPAAFVDVVLEETTPNRMPRWMPLAYATTDRDGNYAFSGRHHLGDPVRVNSEGVQGTAASEPFALDAPGTDVAVPELALAPPATVEGLVLDADQHVAPGVRVWLREWDMATGSQRSGSVTEVITDRQGRYRFLGVPPGGAYLELLVTEQHAASRAQAPFDVEPGQNYAFTLQLPAK